MRVIACPYCEMKYRIDPAKFQQPELRIRCKNCGGSFGVNLQDEASAAKPIKPGDNPDFQDPKGVAAPPPPAPEPPAPAPSPPEPTPPSAPAAAAQAAAAAGGSGTVLVAHDNDDMRDSMTGLLQDAGFAVKAVDNGVDALMVIENEKPAVAVLDVALPKMFGFEVCEIVRRDEALDGVRLLLIAAIYDRTRYKRAPTNLYGADDYIEKHHIPDSLADKVARLSRGETEPASREEAASRVVPPEQEAAEEAERQRIRAAELAASAPPPKPEAPAPAAPAPESATPPPAAPAGQFEEADLERARRLARTIVSDIALYNQEAIEEGVKNGNLRELLEAELDEGRQLFAGRISEQMRDAEPFLDNAIDQLIAAKQKEYGIDG